MKDNIENIERKKAAVSSQETDTEQQIIKGLNDKREEFLKKLGGRGNWLKDLQEANNKRMEQLRQK